MSNKTGIDNIIGNQEIFLYDNTEAISKQVGGGGIGGGISSSPFFLIGLFILAIITFFFFYFIYPENAKPLKNPDGTYRFISILQEAVKEFREWALNKSTQFFTYLHVEGETIKKVIP